MCNAVDTQKQHTHETSQTVRLPFDDNLIAVIPRNENRIALYFSGGDPATEIGAVWSKTLMSGAVGHAFTLGKTPVRFTLEQDGDMVRGPIYIYSDDADADMFYTESTRHARYKE